MDEGGYFTDHLNDFNIVTNHLNSLGTYFEDEIKSC